MDRRVKVRLVGASILIVLIVLIVPELLSGPAPAPVASPLPLRVPEPVRNVTMDLATSKPQTPQQAPDTAASSAPAAPTPVAPPRQPAPAASAPAASAPLEIAKPPSTSVTTAGKQVISGHAWAVQLGSFASHENAENLARRLKGQGFAVYVLSGGSGPSLRYRVRIGPMPDRAAATQTVAKLKSLRQAASLVAPGP